MVTQRNHRDEEPLLGVSMWFLARCVGRKSLVGVGDYQGLLLCLERFGVSGKYCEWEALQVTSGRIMQSNRNLRREGYCMVTSILVVNALWRLRTRIRLTYHVFLS